MVSTPVAKFLPYTRKLLIFALLLLFLQATHQGVMEITFNNIQRVLTTYAADTNAQDNSSSSYLHLLFHNPQCSHSREYLQQFLKVSENDAQAKLGVVDCLREIQLCQRYERISYGMYPFLAKFKIALNEYQQVQDNHKSEQQIPKFEQASTKAYIKAEYEHQYEQIDQYEFLANRIAASNSDQRQRTHSINNHIQEKQIHSKILSFLKRNYLQQNEAKGQRKHNFAVIILEQQGLQVQRINKLPSNDEFYPNTFYIQPATEENPSRLADSLHKMVNGKLGCWILHYSIQNVPQCPQFARSTSNCKYPQLNKYFCGQAYQNSVMLRRYISQFVEGKLSRFVFQEDELGETGQDTLSSQINKMNVNVNKPQSQSQKASKSQQKITSSVQRNAFNKFTSINTDKLSELLLTERSNHHHNDENDYDDYDCKNTIVIIYFYSEQCPQCSTELVPKDLNTIQAALSATDQSKKKVKKFRFNLDRNQIPRWLTDGVQRPLVHRVPQLMAFQQCSGFRSGKVFRQVFYQNNLEIFFKNVFSAGQLLSDENTSDKRQNELKDDNDL